MSDQRAGIWERIYDIEGRIADLKAALEANESPGVLAQVQRINLYVQDLLLKTHKYRAAEKEDERVQNETITAGEPPGDGEQDAPS